jgi:segregation and condensation protein B
MAAQREDLSPMSTDQAQLTLPSETEHACIATPELGALVEALLLVAPDAPTVAELARGANVAPAEIEAALAWLDEQRDRGWIVQRHGQTVSLSTAPRFAAQVRAFLGLEREAKLSAAALETVAIIAVQQPVTRAEIEAIRGVDSSGVLATLHGRGLIEGTSRRATVGNPIEYGTTPLFLKHFGLRSLADLPPIGMVNGQDGRHSLEQAAHTAGADELPEETPGEQP